MLCAMPYTKAPVITALHERARDGGVVVYTTINIMGLEN